jgi:dTDP-glucose 4,6-dehydratase/glucose-1-phosphate thymidylyltransferase long form
MKGLVLAGGKGSRLRPFTYSGAKQLVPIANIPVLHFPVRQLVETGITEIGIVVGDTEAQIREAMGDGSAFGARFTYIHQSAPLGIAHAALVARDFLGDEPFVLYLGDNVLMGGISGFVSAFQASGAPASVLAKQVPEPRAFGVAEFQDGRLVRIVEKPDVPATDFAVIGVYAFTPAVFDVIAKQEPSVRGELEIADAVNGLLAAGHTVQAAVTAEYWIDTGKMEDMLAANRLVLASLMPAPPAPGARVLESRLEGTVLVGQGAVVQRCEIVGPVAIAAGATLRDSRIGPDVAIGEASAIDCVSIRNSIVMERSEPRDCADRRPMIGRFARQRSPRRGMPHARRSLCRGRPVKALVTGGCGFIGSHVVRALLTDGWQVTNLDALTYAANPANVADVGAHPAYTFVHGDICDASIVRKAVDGVDLVFNLAAETHVDRSLLDPGVFVRTDVEGVVCLLEALRDQTRAQLVHMSTDEVFGSLPAPHVAQEDFPFAPSSPYSASKAAAELQIRAYAETYGMPITVLRACNVYGPNQHIEKFIPLFTTRALAGGALPLYGDGLQEREWLYVDDLVAALRLVLARLPSSPGVHAVHIGSGERLPNREVAERICELTERPPASITTVEDRAGHDRRYALDCAGLRALGWAPGVPFDEGLARTVRWYAEHAGTWSRAEGPEFSQYFARQYGARAGMG